MPGTNGLEVLRTLQQRGTRLSVVVVTAHGDIKSAVEAMQLGATDFLAKPYAPDALLDAVDRGIAASKARGAEESSATARMLIERLSSRELEVLQALLEGGTNKSIADALQLSPRTVEMHRARLMTKLGVANLSAALRIAYDAGLTGDRRPS